MKRGKVENLLFDSLKLFLFFVLVFVQQSEVEHYKLAFPFFGSQLFVFGLFQLANIHLLSYDVVTLSRIFEHFFTEVIVELPLCIGRDIPKLFALTLQRLRVCEF